MPDSVTPDFLLLVLAVAVLAGATAAVVGFGIGSLLTPLIALRFDTETAIVVVALPHLAASLLRGWRLRHEIDRQVLLRFGLLSAAGGLAGAMLFARLAPGALTMVLGALLVMTAIAGLTGWTSKVRIRGPLVWILGALSGFFGGIVGNQGGVRAAGLSAFDLPPTRFVATSTAVGVIIDVARTPVYLRGGWGTLIELWWLVFAAAAGAIAGTLIGERVLFGLPPERFRTIVSTAVGILGVWFLVS